MKCDELESYGMDDPAIGEEYEMYKVADVDAAIAELKDKCQMHDFFWEGCGFAKRGFKNTIAVSEAFDRLEAENCRLRRALFIALAYKAKYKKYWYCELLAKEGSKIVSDGKKARKYNVEIQRSIKCEAKCLKKAEEYKR